jgi:hypothetical protein
MGAHEASTADHMHDPNNQNEATVTRDMLSKAKLDLQLSEFVVTYVVERQQKSPEEFDPIEIVLHLFDVARIKLTPEGEVVIALWVLHTYIYEHYLHTSRLLLRSYGPGCGKPASNRQLGQLAATVRSECARLIPEAAGDLPKTCPNQIFWAGSKQKTSDKSGTIRTRPSRNSQYRAWSRENFQQPVLEPIVTAVKYLASRNVDYIIHTGMPVVTTRGNGFEDELLKQIEEVTGLPATAIGGLARSEDRERGGLGMRSETSFSDTPFPERCRLE